MGFFLLIVSCGVLYLIVLGILEKCTDDMSDNAFPWAFGISTTVIVGFLLVCLGLLIFTRPIQTDYLVAEYPIVPMSVGLGLDDVEDSPYVVIDQNMGWRYFIRHPENGLELRTSKFSSLDMINSPAMVERTIRPRYASGFLDFLHDAGNREDTFILIPEDLVKVVLGSTPIPTS